MTKRMTVHKKQATLLDHRPTVSIETITPEIAEELLAHNPKNRNFREKKIKQYVAQILENKWQLNGETIKICQDGTLLDGQHRLGAIIQAQIPIDIVVVRNLSRDVFSTIDIGSLRTAKDYLFIEGFKYPDSLAGAARTVEVLKSNTEIQKHAFKYNRSDISLDRIIEIVEEHPELSNAVNLCNTVFIYTSKLIGKSITPALFYLFKQKDPTLAREFFEQLNSGAISDKESVVLKCRERLIEERLAHVHTRGGDEYYRACSVIRTWNLIRKNLWDVRLVQPKDAPIPIIE